MTRRPDYILNTYKTISRITIARLHLSSLNLRSSTELLLSVVTTLKVWLVVPLRFLPIESEDRRCEADSKEATTVVPLSARDTSRSTTVALLGRAVATSSEPLNMLVVLFCCDTPRSFISRRYAITERRARI